MPRPRKSTGSVPEPAQQPSTTRSARLTRSSLPAPATSRRDLVPTSDNNDHPVELARPVQYPIVVIPTSTAAPPSTGRRKMRPRVAASHSETASAASSTRDNSVEYDTPATSATNTPPTRSLARTLPVSSKRKRSSRLALEASAATDTDKDAELAAALQQEEYQDDSANDLPNIVGDSEVDDLSDAYEEPESDSDDSRPLKRLRARHFARPKSTSKTSVLVQSVVGDSDTTPSVPSANASDAATDDHSDFVQDDDPEEVEEQAADATDVDEDAPASARGRRGRGRGAPRGRRRPPFVSRAARERLKLEKAHPEIITMWDDLRAVPMIPKEQAPQPPGISRQLKSFQLEGLHWMRQQEQTQWKGGLLGDEMGMGKTIQAVSLIMSDYPQKQPTLVAVPPVALMQWSNEINQYTDGKLKVLVYHGSNSSAKKMTVKQLMAFDVIMISYSGLESIYRKETKGWSRKDNIVKEDSPIHAITFHRLILDEAHSIKSRTTGVAKACFALKGKYKWCLSGTPVQNRIGEFFSLLRFLEVSPYANYFCKSCPCSALHWSVDVRLRCSKCKHRTLDHVSVFNQEILNPIIGSESVASRRAAFAKLRLLTDRIMLRRMKRDHTSAMELPPKEVVIHNEFFGPIESDFASSIMNNTARQFDTYVSRGVMLNNYANIFGLIMQMRQVADHPDLILRKHAAEGQNVLVCHICDEPAEDAIRSQCKHEFCRACVQDFIKSYEDGEAPGCPRCHIPLSIDLEQPEIEQDEDAVKKTSIINRIKMENWTSSTKIEMLVYDLWKLRSKKQTTKSIVFSQFTSMLQLVEWRLRRAGFNTVMLDGSMTPQQRQKSIEHFMTNADVEVFLVSLKAGGVALNLTEASRVFIIDPWWNPAAEWQSADRCHRIGQRRPCVITRLVVEDSIESRIVMLQEKKAQMIQGTVNNDDVAIEKLTPQDMQFLFRGS